MSDETTEQEQSEAPSGPKPVLAIAAIVLGLLMGGASGAFVVGPLLAKKPPAHGRAVIDATGDEGGASEEHADAKHDEGDAKSAKGEKGEKGDAKKAMHVVDNVIINPAGSNGTRFLMMTASFELKSDAVAEDMNQRDAEVRDVILRVLGTKTVEQLSDPSFRDPLKDELRAAVEQLFDKGVIRKVYFPQFVIQ